MLRAQRAPAKRCHTVLFSGYAHTWEQGAQGNGGSHVNSGEARDLMLASCVDCHMVKKNMGLAYSLTNYHRIGSPTDPERLYRDRPIECAGCHATYSVERIAKALEQWTPRVDRKRLRALYGSMNANVLIATLQRGKSHERATAAIMAKDARLTAAVPALLEVLEDPIPLVRLFALDALEHLLGKRIDVNEHLPGPELAAATREFVGRQ